MNRSSIIWLMLVGISGLGHAGVDPDYLIQNYSVGRVSVAMTPAEAMKQYPEARVKRWEPYPNLHVIDIDPASDSSSPPALRLHLDRNQKRIWQIAISDKRYQTPKGITIGSTFGALRKAHPALKIQAQEGEMDQTIVAEIVGEGISCVLQFDEATWRKIGSRREIPSSVIPDDRIIQSISVIPKL